MEIRVRGLSQGSMQEFTWRVREEPLNPLSRKASVPAKIRIGNLTDIN